MSHGKTSQSLLRALPCAKGSAFLMPFNPQNCSRGRDHCHSHVTDEDTEAVSREVACFKLLELGSGRARAVWFQWAPLVRSQGAVEEVRKVHQ